MMNKLEFDFLWEHSIFPLIQKCDREMEHVYKASVSLRIRDLDEYKLGLKNYIMTNAIG